MQFDNKGRKFKQEVLISPPTLGCCELVDAKGRKFFELTKNGGHLLFLPPDVLKGVVREVLSKMADSGEKSLLLISQPLPTLPMLLQQNIKYIVKEFTHYFPKENALFMEETPTAQGTTCVFRIGDRKLSEGEVIERITNSTTYLGSLMRGNPNLLLPSLESKGAFLFHLVNNILAPKDWESEVFAEEEGFVGFIYPQQLVKEGASTSDILQRLEDIVHEGTQVGDKKLVVAKFFGKDMLHGGGKYVWFIPSKLFERKKKAKKVVRELKKYEKIGFYKFMYSLFVKLDEKLFSSHMRYVGKTKSGEEVFIFKIVPYPNKFSIENASPIELKQALNTGRKGDVLVLVIKEARLKKTFFVSSEGSVIELDGTKIEIAFGGENQTPFAYLVCKLKDLVNSEKSMRKEILKKMEERVGMFKLKFVG